jgi:peptidoglycan/LPS O-acetylase OafA/YrhL
LRIPVQGNLLTAESEPIVPAPVVAVIVCARLCRLDKGIVRHLEPRHHVNTVWTDRTRCGALVECRLSSRPLRGLAITMQQSEAVSVTRQVADKPVATDTDWIPAIDGWRALAVAAVVLHHINGNNPLLLGWAIGNLGVAVFFCISGFLAYYVLWRDEHKLGQISYNYFLQRRILRIWPAYFVVIAVAVAHAVSVDDPRASRLAGLLTFTLNIDMAAGQPWPLPELTPLWSIAIEKQFYILAPLMYLVLRSRYAIAFCGAIVLLSNVARHLYISTYSGEPGNRGLYYILYTYADTFVIGALLARFYLEGWRPSRALQTWVAILIIPVLVIVARAWGASLFPPYPAFTALAYAAVPVAGTLAVLMALGNNVAAMILSSLPFRVVGILSYSIYMVHLGALEIAKLAGADVLMYNLLAVATTLALAAALYLVVERPALMLKRKLPPGAAGPFPVTATVGAVSIGLMFHFVARFGRELNDLGLTLLGWTLSAFPHFVYGTALLVAVVAFAAYIISIFEGARWLLRRLNSSPANLRKL